jgi:hypothetical protein
MVKEWWWWWVRVCVGEERVRWRKAVRRERKEEHQRESVG